MAQMNLFKKLMGCLTVLSALLLLAGCETTSAPSGTGAKGSNKSQISSLAFKVDDLVLVTFSGVETVPPQHEERIKEDGTITLAGVGPVQAVGKTPGQLQKEIRDLYVPKLYAPNFNVVVRGQDRFFYVGGEVKINNRYPWVEGLTVVKAIQNAGGITEWANPKKVSVTRSGKTFRVNFNKALLNPDLDMSVDPDDSINVPRRLF